MSVAQNRFKQAITPSEGNEVTQCVAWREQ
mgnify:FL=1